MLFSEPKIPQYSARSAGAISVLGFQCSSASRKFLNGAGPRRTRAVGAVSVLFSEPKIPQSKYRYLAQIAPELFQCSSASRKFLNSSRRGGTRSERWFQCSSASRKFLNCGVLAVGVRAREFQCSSASRKFLNVRSENAASRLTKRFSALQRAENSSMHTMLVQETIQPLLVSVLFSEPKIPQSWRGSGGRVLRGGFSALQRAENSSMVPAARAQARLRAFQCSSASRKFLNREALRALQAIFGRFSALQRAENSSISIPSVASTSPSRFQCSSASRKFLNGNASTSSASRCAVSVLFSEPKIPQ